MRVMRKAVGTLQRQEFNRIIGRFITDNEVTADETRTKFIGNHTCEVMKVRAVRFHAMLPLMELEAFEGNFEKLASLAEEEWEHLKHAEMQCPPSCRAQWAQYSRMPSHLKGRDQS